MSFLCTQAGIVAVHTENIFTKLARCFANSNTFWDGPRDLWAGWADRGKKLQAGYTQLAIKGERA